MAPAVEPKDKVIIDINVVFNKPAKDFTSVEELRSFLNVADAKKLEVLDQLQGDIGRLNEDNEKHSEEIAKHQAAIRKNNDRQIKEISRTNEWESLFHVREKEFLNRKRELMKGPLGSFMSPISLDQEEDNHISAAPTKGLAEKKRGAPADVAKSPRKKKTKTKYKGEIGSKSYKTTTKPRNINTGIKRRDVEAETGMEEDVVSTADQIIAEEDGPPDAFAYDRTPLWIRANDGARLILSCCVERCRKKDFRSLEDLCRHINRKENSNDHGLGNKITSHRHGLQLCGIVYDAADLCLIVKRKPDEEWPSENEGEDMVNNFTVPGREEQEVSEWYRKNESTQEDDDNLEDTDEGSSVYEHEERSRGAEDPHVPINTKGMTSQSTNPLNNQPLSFYSQHSLSSGASESKGKSRAHSSFVTLVDESYSTLDDHQISTEHPLFGTSRNTFSIPDSEDERDQTLSNEKNERRVGQSRSSRGGQSGKLCLRQALTFSEARGASVEL